MLNYGGFARAGNEFLYFIAPDNSLYACAYDKEEERFRLADSVKVYDYGAYVTIGEEYVYFMTTDHESLDICRMNPDGSDITPIYSSVKNDGRVFQGLQYARLSNQGEYLYFLITNAELGTLSSLYRYNLNGKLGTLETVIDGNLYWYNLYRDSIYYTEFSSEIGNYKLMRCALDGKNAQELNDFKSFGTGFVEDESLFLYSYAEEAIMVCNLDGTLRSAPDGGFTRIDTGSVFGYGGGWIYYTGSTDGNLHRIRADATQDNVIIEDCVPAAICYNNQWLWLLENKSTEINHQVSTQIFMAYQDGEKLMKIMPERLSWGMNPAFKRDIQYKNTDAGIVITGYTGAGKRFEIPAVIDDKSVIEIGSSAFVHSEIVELGLPAGVRAIADHAFEGASELSFVGLPDGLLSIGAYAFADCVSLQEITIPKSVQTISENAFKNTKIRTIKVSNSCKIEKRPPNLVIQYYD